MVFKLFGVSTLAHQIIEDLKEILLHEACLSLLTIFKIKKFLKDLFI